jgi:hypothetical protein
MAKHERPQWPCTIIPSRYGGVYEDGEWLAFPLHFAKVPTVVYGGDPYCAKFFAETDLPIGRGDTPQDAYENLLDQVNPHREGL